MFSLFQPDFVKLSRELNMLRRRDVTQALKLAKYKKNAASLMKKDPVSGNLLLGLVACMEHDLVSMHAFHKKAIELSESSFTLMFYAASLHKSCLWNESAKYVLAALDHEPNNIQLINSAIQIAPLTGRFSLLRKLLGQRQQVENKEPPQSIQDSERVTGIFSSHGLTEKDLKAVVAAIGDALSETDLVLENFGYELIAGQPPASFIHYRFIAPDQFVASYYEDLVAAKLQKAQLHPRIFEAFSYSIENATVWELYEYMEKEMADSADTIRVPDPEKMKLIEELVGELESRPW